MNEIAKENIDLHQRVRAFPTKNGCIEINRCGPVRY